MLTSPLAQRALKSWPKNDALNEPEVPSRAAVILSLIEQSVELASEGDFPEARKLAADAREMMRCGDRELLAPALLASHSAWRGEALLHQEFGDVTAYSECMQHAADQVSDLIYLREAGLPIPQHRRALLVGEGEYAIAPRGVLLGVSNVCQCVAVALIDDVTGDRVLIHFQNPLQVRDLPLILDELSPGTGLKHMSARLVGAIQGISPDFDAAAELLLQAVLAKIDELQIKILSLDVQSTLQPRCFVVTEDFHLEERKPSREGRSESVLNFLALVSPRDSLRKGFDLRGEERLPVIQLPPQISEVLRQGDRREMIENLYRQHFDPVPFSGRLNAVVKIASILAAYDHLALAA